MWAEAASLGLSLLGGSAKRQQAKVQATLDRGRADAENIVRAGKNVENAAQASFGNFMASVNNQRALDGAGRAEASARTNLNRMTDALTRGSIEDQIANAESAGAYAASVAMAGTGGSSVTAISRALALKQQRAARFAKERKGQLTYDQMEQIAGIRADAIAGLDIGTRSAGIDYSTTSAPISFKKGNWLMDAAGWALNNPQAAGSLASTTSGFFRADPNQSTWRLMGDMS